MHKKGLSRSRGQFHGCALPLDHGQERDAQPAHVGRCQQASAEARKVQNCSVIGPPPELHRGVGQGLGSGGDDALHVAGEAGVDGAEEA